MTDFAQLRTILAAQTSLRISDTRIMHGNELRCKITRSEMLDLTKLLHDELHARLVLMVGNDRRADKGVFEIHYLFANDVENWFVHVSVNLPEDDPELSSMATFYHPIGRFEREIRDMFGIEAVGHPLSRRLVRHSFWHEDFYPLRKDAGVPEDFKEQGTPYPFLPVEGEGIYEIPVGPVHAGIIEPGHFRFSVVGETIINLQTHLYFTHKGVEKLFENRTPEDGIALAERISGDTTIGHSLAYCQALETLCQCEIPERARYLRVILLEMERIYNHIADFGAICTDAGFAVAHSHCYRIRERLLRINKHLTGNRLLRGGIILGGVANDLPDDLDLVGELDSVIRDFNEIVEISLANTMLIDRLAETGRLTYKTAIDHGVLGFVARGSGIDIDVRRDHPFAAYPQLNFNVPVYQTGDVYARAMVRVDEVNESVKLIQQAVNHLPGGSSIARLGEMPAWEPAWGLVEGWRGAILHWVMLDHHGKLYRVKVKDPSFVNWTALPFAVLKNIVPDFPLCNKSFNQSYSGNDL